MNRDDTLLNSYMDLPQIIRKEETEISFLNSYGSLFDSNPYSFSWREDNIQREVIQKLSRIRESHEHIFSELDKDLSIFLNQRIMQVVSYLHKNNLIMIKELRVLYIDPKVMVESEYFSSLFDIDLNNDGSDVVIDPKDAIDICANLGWKVNSMGMTMDQKIRITFER